MKRKVLVATGLIFIVIQFFRIDKNIPTSDSSLDFITVGQVPDDIQHILKNSCYDCHSNQTKYPWYAEIAPLSWWIGHHIEEGREHLNFSEWGNYSEKSKTHKLEECYEEIDEGEMPMTAYSLVHASARLQDPEKGELIRWLKSKVISSK